MNRRILLVLLAALAAAAVLIWVLRSGPGVVMPGGATTGEVTALPTPTPAPPQRIVLLFTGSDGRLHPELREVPLPGEVNERARLVVQELLTGPTGNLAPVVPYPAEVYAVFVDSGRAFIDITAPPERLEGSNIELMLVYGIVDSVLLNCPELSAVQILFNGAEVPTLTGHLDLSKPLVLNRRFIAS